MQGPGEAEDVGGWLSAWRVVVAGLVAAEGHKASGGW